MSVNLPQASRLPLHRRLARKIEGHGSFNPWPSESTRATGVTCPWHPTLDYFADAPGRPGSARMLISSDSTRVVMDFIARSV